MEWQPGMVLDGSYRLRQPLGDGMASSVWEAEPVAGGGAVAVKLLDQKLAKSAEHRTRFEREARALNGLDHPHLIRFHDFGVAQGDPYLVMERLSGGTLEDLLTARLLDPREALGLGLGIVAGLAHAHAHGVIHRDLKPANIFVANMGGVPHPKLLDFGLARFLDADRWGPTATVTEQGAILGTPVYMAPEQGFGQRADERSDVYAAGIVLYELLTGRPPFTHPQRAMLLRMHAMERVPDPKTVRTDLRVRGELARVLLTALAKERDDRFPTALELLREMQELPEPAAYLIS